ncbi:MAG: sensor histidine kinase [Candidatus Komeilibacteria bacterium]
MKFFSNILHSPELATGMVDATRMEEVNKNWEKEKEAWREFVERQLWPAYESGVKNVSQQFKLLSATVATEKVDHDHKVIQEANELARIARQALESFDKLSNDLRQAHEDKFSLLYFSIAMVNHSGRKYFEAANEKGRLITMLAQAHEFKTLNEVVSVGIDDSNRLDKENFLNILEQGNPKDVNMLHYLRHISARLNNESTEQYPVLVSAAVSEDYDVRMSHGMIITEIIKEFVNNAREEMSAGGKIILDAEEVDRKIKISVADDGPGIPKDLQKKIFLPKDSTRAHGQGLGLYQVQKIVSDFLHGEVEVKSSPGEGAKFSIIIPEAQ